MESKINSPAVFKCAAALEGDSGSTLIVITWDITKTNGESFICQYTECEQNVSAKTTQDDQASSKNSTLTFLTISESDDQAKIFCIALYKDSSKFISDTVTLTVLGVGAVKQFQFTNSPPTLSWDKPFTSPDVANVEYHLVATESVTGQSIDLPPTNETYYNVTYDYLRRCSNYTITVIGKAPGYDGVPYSVFINLPGGMDTITHAIHVILYYLYNMFCIINCVRRVYIIMKCMLYAHTLPIQCVQR